MRTRYASLLSLAVFALAACSRPSYTGNLAQAKRGFTTHLTQSLRSSDPLQAPPPGEFRLVRYPSSVGQLAAYVTRTPQDGRKRPAIVWVFGGFDNSIGETAWAPATPDDDQSARAFREAGIITMYPSFRGGSGNPGVRECLYGEVGDTLAAAAWLARQPGVDPKRVYLGGHSTGGTLALLAAASGKRFRAAFAFGPVATVDDYPAEERPFGTSDRKEVDLRSPIHWLHAIECPTFVFEGEEQPGNIGSLHQLQGACKNAKVHFHPAPGVSHFSILAQGTPVIARKIVDDA